MTETPDRTESIFADAVTLSIAAERAQKTRRSLGAAPVKAWAFMSARAP